MVLGNVEFSNRLGESDENGVTRTALIAGIEFGLPFIEQGERRSGISHFVAEVVGDPAIGVDVEEILAEVLGEEPGGYGEVLVVRASELAAVFLGLRK